MIEVAYLTGVVVGILVVCLVVGCVVWAILKIR